MLSREIDDREGRPPECLLRFRGTSTGRSVAGDYHLRAEAVLLCAVCLKIMEDLEELVDFLNILKMNRKFKTKFLN